MAGRRLLAVAALAACVWLLAADRSAPALVGALVLAICAAWLMRDSGLTTQVTLTPDEGWDALERELERSRRHERPFVLASTVLDADASTHQVGRVLRRLDRSWRTDRRLFILMPETTSAAAAHVVKRLASLDAGAAAGWRQAAFPDDGLTLAALIDRATRVMPADRVAAQGHVESGG